MLCDRLETIMQGIRYFQVAAIAFTLAACEAQHNSDLMLDPMVAQQIVAAQADPDAALADKVKTALGLDAGQGAYGIEVTAADGTVDLWGTVDNTAARKRFVTTAAGVVGVRALRDHIQVDPGA
jgi:osmotically-inducible protein OsmY